MKGFEILALDQQFEVLSYKPNFHGLSETANTSRWGLKSMRNGLVIKKGG